MTDFYTNGMTPLGLDKVILTSIHIALAREASEMISVDVALISLKTSPAKHRP